ncbi:hypothetical protein [Vibrio taketomensis]|uniref:hypothetical protein n=1 Tax=Vibrio taketomensis TaxID=2572923 RepID=UPI00138A6185|nr:hypothetical protein [Vibrio taketomensis]
MNFRKILFVAVVVFMIVQALIGLNGSEDHIKSLRNFHAQTPYTVTPLDAQRFNIAEQGKLGDMSACMNQVKSKMARQVPDSDKGVQGLLRINSGDYKIYLSVYGNEAYSIRLMKSDEAGNHSRQTTSYSINCDLRLIN